MYNRVLENEVLRLSELFKVITITGPRQSGKTTLCKKTFPHHDYVNLEDETVVGEMELNKKEFLVKHRKGLVIDEVQKMPEILSAVQVVVDEYPDAAFVLTGSNNLLLMQRITQSLAGRTAVLTLLPFSIAELTEVDKSAGLYSIMLNGFYPAVWAQNIPPQDVYRQYFSTYLQRDVRQVMNIRHLSEFRRFIVICASRIGSEFNAQGISNELGVSIPTIQEWMNVLETSYVAFRLPPFFRNIGKRLVKTPKIYFYDVGLVCYLLGIHTPQQLETHPLRGSIFENMVVCDFLKNQYNHGLDNNLYFYRDKSQHEVDLVVEDGLQLNAYEIKLSSNIHPDFYKNLNYFRSLFSNETVTTQVINTGQAENDSSENGHRFYLNVP
ncbi:MAG: ATP-binding protein [Bacteroidales bacterium]|nr:ATP-binding protein [Bacteroidales bacterium]MDY6348691.1 ATP-binding protein [Bacteroidales bacterium]